MTAKPTNRAQVAELGWRWPEPDDQDLNGDGTAFRSPDGTHSETVWLTDVRSGAKTDGAFVELFPPLDEHAYTDPPGMPADERMDPAELRTIREFLGVTGEFLAARLKVSPRTVRHWEGGKYAIPDGVRKAVEEFEQITADAVGEYVQLLNDQADPTMLTYRDDDDYRQAYPHGAHCASWHRAVTARVALEVPGLAIRYWKPGDIPTGRTAPGCENTDHTNCDPARCDDAAAERTKWICPRCTPHDCVCADLDVTPDLVGNI